MGSRTRAHMLEDESRNQFKLILPPEWVISDKTKDYGIDCEVEIFDKGGMPTGHVFWVQLKATDAKEWKQKLSFRISQTKLAQLTDYPLQVLFARFASDEKAFYIQWARNVSFINSRKKTSTLNVGFLTTDIWSSSTPALILNYLQKVKFVKNGANRLPIICFVDISNSFISLSHLISLRKEISAYRSVLEVARKKEDAMVCTTFYDERMFLSMMDQYGVSFTVDKESSPDFDLELTVLFIIGLSILFAQQNKHDMVQHIFEIPLIQKALKENPKFLIHILPSLLNDTYIIENLSYLLQVLEEIDDVEFSATLNLIIVFLKGEPNENTKKAILNFLEVVSEKAKQTENNQIKAISIYNVGLFHKEEANYKKAYEYLNKARKIDTLYLERDYFWMDIGATCFESQRYSMAACAYKKSIALNDSSPLKHALYGDALMFKGKYELARDEFQYYLSNLNSTDTSCAVWNLKFSCITTLLKIGYENEQRRNPLLAEQLALELKPNEITLDKFDEILKVDLLYPNVWFNKGVFHSDNGEYSEAFFAFLMSALLNGPDVEAWRNCTLLCFNTDQTLIFLKFIINVAHFYCGEEYIVTLIESIEQSPNSQNNELIKLIDGLVEEQKSKQKEFRFIHEDGSFEKIKF